MPLAARCWHTSAVPPRPTAGTGLPSLHPCASYSTPAACRRRGSVLMRRFSAVNIRAASFGTVRVYFVSGSHYRPVESKYVCMYACASIRRHLLYAISEHPAYAYCMHIVRVAAVLAHAPRCAHDDSGT